MTPDEQYMHRALELARKGEGRTSPNPAVGAVLVKDDVVIGEGFHPEAGQPHAEIYALEQAGAAARGADLYVTLEPCCHHGRTGPCTAAVIAAGIRRVHVGVLDPNPRVAGNGVRQLQQAGIEVHTGVMGDPCRRLIAPFAKHVTTGRPYVILKAAMTLDGKTATRTGASQWISSAESRERVHRLRDKVDAILVGSGTVEADDPRLTTRLPDGGRNPVRIVLDGGLVTSEMAKVYAREDGQRRILMTGEGHLDSRLAAFRQRGVEVVAVQRTGEHLDLECAMDRLGDMGVQSILLEGGSALSGAMLRAGLVDRVMLFVAPLLLGGADGNGLFGGQGVAELADAFQLEDLQVDRVGPDILIEGEVRRCSPV